MVGVRPRRQECLQLEELVSESRSARRRLLDQGAIADGVKLLPEVIADVVMEGHDQENEIRFQLHAITRQVLQLVVGPPSAHACVHDLDPSAGSLVEGAFHEARQGLLERNLQCLHERIAEHQHPEYSLWLPGSMLSVSHPDRVERRGDAELRQIGDESGPVQGETVTVLMPYP